MSKTKNRLQEKLHAPVSVLEAKRIHSGDIAVRGTIVSVSEMYVIENEGSQIGYKDAKTIQLEDTEKLDQNELLDVTLYDDMIQYVRAGELVQIVGTMKVQDKKDGSSNRKSKKKIVILHAQSIKYLNRKELVITSNDIVSFERFAALTNPVDRLVSMFAPNIIQNSQPKLAILRSEVGGIEHGKIRGRINTLLVGDPGTAKSTLAREAVEVKPNSRYVSGPHSSARTITAIIEKDKDSLTLKLGAIPLSSGAICSINEITAFAPDEQGRLLDVLEEGIILLNKHGTHMIIPAPTTIIATANPIESRWNDSQKVSKDEIALLRTMIDRFDQLCIFRDSTSVSETREFVQEMDKIRDRRIHNYNFLRKYLLYASSIDVKVAPEARQMLGEFFVRARVQGSMSKRGYFTIFRLAEAQAKLQLKSEVDADIATQTMEYLQSMIVQYGEFIKEIKNPRDVTLNIFLEILENSKAPVALSEMCKIACRRDEQIKTFLGANWSTGHNHKLRDVVELVRNHSRVRVVSSKPMVFEWLFDVFDVFDVDSKNSAREAN